MPATLGFETDDSGYPPISDYDAYVMKRFLSGFYFTEDGREAPFAGVTESVDPAPTVVTEVSSDVLNAQVPMDGFSDLAAFGDTGDFGALLDAPETPAAAPEPQAAPTGGIGGLLIRFLDAARIAEQNLIAALEAERATAGDTIGLDEVAAATPDLPFGQETSASFDFDGNPVSGPLGAVDQGAGDLGAEDALAFSDVIDGLETLANFTLSPGDYVL